MRISIRKIGLFVTLWLLVTTHDLYAQPGQCLGGGCNTGVSFGAAQSTSSNTFVNAIAGTWAGEYNSYNVTLGQQYEWSLCTADGATNPTADMTMTLTNDATNAIICFSDNVCGTQPKILWTSTFTGVVRVYIHTPACGTNTTSHTVRWRCVSCAAPVAPTNDLICNATPITCGQTLAGTTVNATLSGTGEGLACFGTPTQPAVWYTVAGNGQIMTATLCGTVWDSRIQVFSGANCSSVTCVGGNDDNGPACAGTSASYQWTSVVGVNYYILVAGFASTSAFNLALTCAAPPTPPANDLICNATPVTCGQSLNGTTVNATPSGTGEGQACGGFTQNQPGVWYSIVGSGSNINASLCATAWDSRIQVFTGASCNTVTCVGGNDNNGPLCAGNAASYSWLAVNGQTYYILVSGATATTSAFTLSIACQTPCTTSCNGGPPPANDACGGAQNLGVIPTPPACPNGVGTPVNFNTTNVCATAEPNYSSLLGCTPAGNQATPAADVWYRFTIVAPILNITINGLGTPNVALYEGTNCANLVPRACAIGSGGFLNTQFQGLAPGTYYLQVSGGDVLDQCTFTLTLQNNYDCAGCVLAASLDATPPPVSGQYQPGTLVTFCFTVTSYQQTSANWLHGIIPTFGPGWDLTTFNPLATTTTGGGTASSCATAGTWSYYSTNVTSSATGSVTGPGFYFETAAGGPGVDTNPGNNYGDFNPGNCAWTFCWQIRTKQISQCVQDQSLNMTVNTTGDGESGSWTSLACTQDPLVNFFAQSNCCPTPTITVTNPTCAVPTGSAVGQGLGTSPWTYVWKNAAGATLQTNANTAGTSTITGLAPGDYTLTVTDATGCTSFVAFSIVAPANNSVTAASSNPTVCINTAITPVTFTTTGATGIGAPTGLPAGLSAVWLNNTITVSGTPTVAGTFNYSIPLTGGCGNVNATGTITVNPLRTAGPPSSNPVLCVNTAISPVITIATTGATGIGAPAGLPAGVTATWAANTITISGTPTAAGIFNYTIPLTGGCGSANASGTITVRPLNTVSGPSLTPSLCANTVLPAVTFTTTGATGIGAPTNLPPGVTASWSNNTITLSGTPTVAGVYAYSIPLTGGCGTVNATGTITVNAAPTATLTSSTSLCPGSASTINFTGTPNAVLSWSTSAGATGTFVLNASGVANIGPSSINAGWASWPAGTVITFSQVSINNCPTPINFVITVTSSLNVTVTAQSPICAGSTSQLTFTGTPSATVTYNIGAGNLITNTGPTGSVTVASPVLTANTTVTVTLVQIAGGCSQVLANTATIVVNPVTTPLFNPIGPFCYSAAAPALPATSTNGVSGTWSPAAINTNIVGVTNYTFTPSVTCPAPPVVVPVTVNPLPTVYAHGTNPTCSTLCNGSAVVDITNATAPYAIVWSNGGNTASITNLCEGTYNVTVTDANGCVSQAFTPVSGCFQIQSILVDACGDGNSEGLNEMVFFQTGTTALNTSGASVTWPSNSFTNFNCTNQAFIDAINPTITAGGILLPVPATGIIPPNANVVIITSNTTTITPNSFASLSDTLYVMFHCSSVTAGYFGNSTATVTPRTLTISFGGGCTDAVTYQNNLLININGTTGGSAANQNGSYVNFSQSGTASYTNYGCLAPFAVQDNSVVLDAPEPVLPTFVPVGPYCSGDAIPALPTSSTNVPPITGTWAPPLSNTATTTYTFTPTAGLCATTAPLTITITPLTLPTFNPIAQLCYGATPIPTLPTTSLNLITGTWSPSIISNTASGNYIFTPNPNQCATTATLSTTVSPQVVVDGIYHN